MAVTLNDGNDWNDHASLLDFGFNHYPLKTLVERGEAVKGYSLVTGKAFAYPLGQGRKQGSSTSWCLVQLPRHLRVAMLRVRGVQVQAPV